MNPLIRMILMADLDGLCNTSHLNYCKQWKIIDLDNEEPPNKSLQSPLSSKNTNLATTAHEIRRKVMEVFAPDWNNLEDEA
ncbi:unnamed protein product [Rhizophagus irregularis]|uniref:Uncharacterized protein n=1 Tax=Rhizophagus irregularis TaxID=588596 RepID=A0A915Z2T9_9GLOM|nr:unnamed protein product [Rhizophagus irregularis]CAB5359571.1 unnamed protein product [Rhizophagus irregularis]